MAAMDLRQTVIGIHHLGAKVS